MRVVLAQEQVEQQVLQAQWHWQQPELLAVAVLMCGLRLEFQLHLKEAAWVDQSSLQFALVNQGGVQAERVRGGLKKSQGWCASRRP